MSGPVRPRKELQWKYSSNISAQFSSGFYAAQYFASTDQFDVNLGSYDGWMQGVDVAALLLISEVCPVHVSPEASSVTVATKHRKPGPPAAFGHNGRFQIA